MGNQCPRNKVGLAQNFTDEEFALYEPNCRPSGSELGPIDKKYGYLGISFSSMSGFINETESLKEVVMRDVATITRLLGKCDQETHRILAYGLHWLVSDDTTRKEEAAQEGEAGENARKWQALYKVDPSKITVLCQGYGGNQGCPFWRDNVPWEDKDDPDRTEQKLGHSTCGCCGGVDYHITKETPDGPKKLFFGAIVSSLIARHGFYEGSVPHRIDPQYLIEFLEIPIRHS